MLVRQVTRFGCSFVRPRVVGGSFQVLPTTQYRFARGRASDIKIKPVNENDSFFRLKNTQSVPEAIQIIEENENKQNYYHAALINPSRVGNTDFVSAISKHMEKNSVQWNEKTFDLLMKAYAKRLDFITVATLFEQMKQKNIKPDAQIYATIIHLHSRCNKVNESLKFLKESVDSGCLCDYKAFLAVLKVQVTQDKLETAYEVISIAKQVELDGIKHLYDELIQAYACREDLKKVRVLIDEMQASGIYVRPFVLEMLEQYEEHGLSGAAQTQ